MRALVFMHRWLGVTFCLFFAMWFLTGIVMHFVAFPALTEYERVEGLGAIHPTLGDTARTVAAVQKLNNATRVRLIERSDGPVFIAQNTSGILAVHPDLSPARLQTPDEAVTIAAAHAKRRGMKANMSSFISLDDYDQWTVSNGLDPHRPLYRIALNDEAATELYVSSATGEVVRDTTRFERGWNYAGSVLHWIYPTALRKHWHAWDRTVWMLSLAALIAVMTGTLLGVLRLKTAGRRLATPFRGWQAWHHWAGLGCAIFVFTWIFSGWLSMDHGRLFSRGELTSAEEGATASPSAWEKLSPDFEVRAGSREIEWFVLGRRLFRRDRSDFTAQTLASGVDLKPTSVPFLSPDDIASMAARLGSGCHTAASIMPTDAYAVASSMPAAPVYRLACGDTWFHIDGANGNVMERLDSSRRTYRWLYQGLHTLDFPSLKAHPDWRTALITILCLIGASFSVTALVLGWRRIKASV